MQIAFSLGASSTLLTGVYVCNSNQSTFDKILLFQFKQLSNLPL